LSFRRSASIANPTPIIFSNTRIETRTPGIPPLEFCLTKQA
jgi:hypothetical protein